MPSVPFALQCSFPENLEVDCTFTIESANDSFHLQYIYEESYCWGYWICKTDDFFDAKKKYIVDGKFTIKVNGTFKFENGIPAGVEQQKWDGGEFGDEAWKKEDTKDFTITTADGKEITVHKFVLDVRSEVFTAMLNSNMKEAKENKVEITDFSFNVVEAGIRLIYDCNFMTTLSVNDLMLLLQFFDKYQLPVLKAKVEPFLINQISAATVVLLTNASILTNSFKLKEKCTEFLSASFESKTPLSDIKILDKDVLLEVIENSLYHIVEIKE